MVLSKTDHILRRKHLALLKLQAKDQSQLEGGLAALKTGRLRFELEWGNCEEYWQLLKSENLELPRQVNLLMVRVFRAGILPNPKRHGASWHASNREVVGRYEALLWCDVHIEGITRYLSEIRIFKERNLADVMEARLKERRKKGGRTLKEWQAFQIKHRIHQHTKMKSFPAQVIERVSPIVKVGWMYARYAVLLKQLTLLSEADIEAMIRRQYWRYRKQSDLSPAVFSEKNYFVFGGWVKQLLEHLDPSLPAKQKKMVADLLQQCVSPRHSTVRE